MARSKINHIHYSPRISPKH